MFNRPTAAPVAVADSYLMLMGTTLTVDIAHGVLANDTDADGDPMTAEPVRRTNG